MAAETAIASAPAPTPAGGRPQKPDENVFKAELEKAEKAHKAAMDRLNAVKAKIDVAMPNKNKDQPSPTQKRRQELIAQANEIRQKQAGGKNARTSKLDQIKRLDEQVRSRISEQKNAKAKIPYKGVEDVDRQIANLDAQVNSGTMKLVDERKALADISSLRKIRKNFGQFDDSQKQIDELRAKIKEIKDSMEDPEQKAMSEQYNKIQAELDQIKAEQDTAYKGLSSLRDERTKLHAEQQETFTAIRKLKDDYYSQKKAAMAYEREAREKARERREAENKRYHLERKKAEAERLLSEASDPAYLEEIRRANNLLVFLDPSQKTAEKTPLLAASGMTAQAQRTVDASGLKGTALKKKEDREEDYLPAAKKGKKGKKGGASATTKGYNCPPSVVEDCAFMGIDPPMSADDVPTVVEKVQAKLNSWKADQAAQTQKNVDAAKKRIEELDKADEDTNGDKTDKVAEDLSKASISEKQDA
ncbi:hypothetical protein V2A60_003074 [Cordyceps javanica]|uniref:Nuclear segregation protein (Bfr1) n=1 Tax=Cordyceps javanica TaxID=43265 RepID=A0A545V494_9HYPO|nr:nuclear segregation protein (Bfr1) [Cordyceps javanica]TQW07818.1 nuclear segregation protein (Bfr1) [Cordyceps javanica]